MRAESMAGAALQSPVKFSKELLVLQAVILMALMVAQIATPFLVSSAQEPASEHIEITSIEITIRSTGVVEAVMEVTAGPGIVEIPLPTKPIAATVLVETSTGATIPPIIEDGKLIIPLDSADNVIVSFLVDTVESNGVISFPVTPPAEVKLVVFSGVVLLGLPTGIQSYENLGDRLIIVFTGESQISFIPAAYTPPGGGEATTATPPTETPSTGADADGGGDGSPFSLSIEAGTALLVLAIAVGVIIALLYFKQSRRRGEEQGGYRQESNMPIDIVDLDSTDKMILDVLRDMGGEASQPELLRETGLPKSTLWRRLKKLESMGYLEIERKGKTNLVRLKKYYSKGQDS